LADRNNFKDFLDKLDNEDLGTVVVKPGKKVPEELREVSPPGPTVPLENLRRSHPARTYLHSRGYDPDRLSNRYKVSYCKRSVYSYACNRIIVPVLVKNKLKGWQARFIGDLDWKGPNKKVLPPKYYNSPGSHFKSGTIFNFDRMQRWYTGVIVEGVTDVFGFGDMAGCIFGKKMSDRQIRDFVSAFRKRSGVLLLDPEEMEKRETQELLRVLHKAMPGRICPVTLPLGTDPGSLSPEFSRQYVKHEARKKNVIVKFQKV
jgi:hypothetical protein